MNRNNAQSPRGGPLFGALDRNAHTADRIVRCALNNAVLLAHANSFLALHHDELSHHACVLMFENVAVIHVRA